MNKNLLVVLVFSITQFFSYSLYSQQRNSVTNLNYKCNSENYFLNSPFRICLEKFEIINDSAKIAITVSANRKADIQIILHAELFQRIPTYNDTPYDERINKYGIELQRVRFSENDNILVLPLNWEQSQSRQLVMSAPISMLMHNEQYVIDVAVFLTHINNEDGSQQIEQAIYYPIILSPENVQGTMLLSSGFINGKEIMVTPNPSYGEITIKNAGGSNINLYNISGQLLKTFKNVSNLELINLTDLMPAEYLLVIVLDKETVVHRLILKN